MLDRLSFIRSAILMVPVLSLFGSSSSSAQEAGTARELNKRGEDLIERGRYAEAFEVFKNMLKACRGREYCRGIAIFYLGRCRLELADYDGALKLFDRAEVIFAKLNKENEKATVMQAKARLFAERSQYRKSLALYDGAAEVFARVRNKDALFDLFNSSGAVHILLGLSDQGMECMSVASQLLSAKPHPRQLALLNNNTGLAKAGKQDYAAAQDSFNKALTHFKESGNIKGMGTAFNNVGFIHEAKSEYAQSLESHQKALDTARQIQDARGEALALNNLGNVRLKTGDYAGALKLYEESLKISDQRGIRQFVAETLNNMGLVQVAHGDYAKAVDSFKKSLRISNGVGALTSQAWALHNIAFIFKDQGKFKEARRSSEAALQLAEKTGDRRLEATVVLRLGNLNEYKGLFERASKDFQRAERIQKEITDRFFRANTLTDLGDMLTRNGDFPSAQKNFQEAVDIRTQIGAPVGPMLCKFALFFIEKQQYGPSGLKNNQVPGDRSKELTMAGDYIRQAEKLIKPEETHDLLALTYVKAKHALDQDPGKARDLFKNVKTRSESSGVGRYVFLGSVGLGLACERLSNWVEAEAAFSTAVQYAEKIRETLDSHEKITFLSGEQILGMRHKMAYDGLARVLEVQGKKPPTFQPLM